MTAPSRTLFARLALATLSATTLSATATATATAATTATTPAATAAATAPAPALSPAPGAIDTSDREAVVDAYFDRWLPAYYTMDGWTGDVDSCDPGTQPDEFQQATLDAINYVRSQVGVAPVTLSAELSAKAQKAALIMHANGTLDHHPSADQECYTAEGAEAAGSSNLSMGSTGPGSVLRYMTDSGDHNRPVGHRRWLINPGTRIMGSGSTDGYNAMWVIPDGWDSTGPAPEWLTWPTAGYFPVSLEPEGRWSISSDDPSVDFANATVQVQGPGGRTLPVTVWPVEDGYGPSTLSWDGPEAPALPRDGEASYDVRVDGATRGGSPVGPIEYTVTFVQPHRTMSVLEAPKVTGPGAAPYRVGSTLRARSGRWSSDYSPGEIEVVWLRDGKPIPYEDWETYTLAPEDAGHVIAARISPLQSDELSGGAVTVQVGRIKPGPPLRAWDRPRVAGTPSLGALLRAVPNYNWSPVGPERFAYKWFRGSKAIPTATRRTYRVAPADLGRRITVRVTARARGYLPGSALSRPTAAARR